MFLVRNRGINRLRQCQRRLSKNQNSPSNQLIPTKRQKQGHTRLFAVNPRVYVEIIEKTTCICDCELKTRVQEERCIKIKENRQAETNFTPIRHHQENMPPDLTQKQERKSNSKSLNVDKIPPKDNYQELPSGITNSDTERSSYGLGYHNKHLDSRNQSFPICNRN